MHRNDIIEIELLSFGFLSTDPVKREIETVSLWDIFLFYGASLYLLGNIRPHAELIKFKQESFF